MSPVITFPEIVASRDRIRPLIDPSPARHYPQLDTLVGHGIRVMINQLTHVTIPIAFGAMASVTGYIPVFLGCAAMLFGGGEFYRRSSKQDPAPPPPGPPPSTTAG